MSASPNGSTDAGPFPVTYSLERKGAGSFLFSLDDTELLIATCSALIVKSSFSVTRPDKTPAGTLTVADGKKRIDFVGTDGAAIAKVKFTFPNGNTLLARRIHFTGFEPGGDRLVLHSKAPTAAADGRKGLYFGGRLTVASVKNAILADPDDPSDEVIGIRKIAKEVLELDSLSDVRDVHVFAAGMAAWLGP
jgi:hypothetical protein